MRFSKTSLEQLQYDPILGEISKGERRVGTLRKDGYRSVTASGKVILEHRLAWFLMCGEWPDSQIDHINGIRDDNRWANLRKVTPQQNQFNTGIRKDNSTGCKGVSKRGNHYRAYIYKDGKQVFLGNFKTLESAAEARALASSALFGVFSRT